LKTSIRLTKKAGKYLKSLDRSYRDKIRRRLASKIFSLVLSRRGKKRQSEYLPQVVLWERSNKGRKEMLRVIPGKRHPFVCSVLSVPRHRYEKYHFDQNVVFFIPR